MKGRRSFLDRDKDNGHRKEENVIHSLGERTFPLDSKCIKLQQVPFHKGVPESDVVASKQSCGNTGI
jgi:hypothetical protein